MEFYDSDKGNKNILKAIIYKYKGDSSIVKIEKGNNHLTSEAVNYFLLSGLT